jgi:hypothetical protein
LGFFKHNIHTSSGLNIKNNKSTPEIIPESIYVIIGKYLMQQQAGANRIKI